MRFFALLVLLLPLSLSAHQQKTALTEILLNSRSGNLEVSHRFILHDAEHALSIGSFSEADLYASDEARQVFYQYALDNFSVQVNEEHLAFQNLGYEIVGRYFWIYQEAPFSEDIQILEIRHTSLTEIWPEQTNLINVRLGEQLESIELSAEKPSDRLSF